MNIKLNKEELDRLVIAVDFELDGFRNLPYEIEQLDPEQQATYKTLESLYTRLVSAQQVATRFAKADNPTGSN